MYAVINNHGMEESYGVCRNGIEGLNDTLVARGFAMNEDGGILKVTCFIIG